MYAWGSNTHGEQGTGYDDICASSIPVPATTPAGLTYTAISAGNHYSLAIASDGTAWSWGWNDHGQLGIGVIGDRRSPVLTNVTAISAGVYHSLVLTRP